MRGLRARLSRVRGFAALVVALVVGSVAFVTALAYWYERIGVLGIAVVGALALGVVVTVFALPESAWQRITTGPEARARAEAIEALSRCIADSDAIRARWFRERPSAEVMKAEFGQWFESARDAVAVHAPDYRADFQRVQSVLAVSYPGFKMDQDEVIMTFDARRETLLQILDGVRRG